MKPDRSCLGVTCNGTIIGDGQTPHCDTCGLFVYRPIPGGDKWLTVPTLRVFDERRKLNQPMEMRSKGDA